MRPHFVGRVIPAVLILFSVMIMPTVGVGTQSPSIVGRVADGMGQPIPGVSVTAMIQTGGVASRAMTDTQGAYHFDALLDGSYRVDFELLGFDVARLNHVRVARGVPAAGIDATLLVSAICECVNVLPPTPGRERAGQVLDESGHPLMHARLEIGRPIDREWVYADGGGRFRVRLPVNDRWPLTVSDGGFRPQTQQLSGADTASIVFKLASAWPAGLPDVERFRGSCCPGLGLFTHEGR